MKKALLLLCASALSTGAFAQATLTGSSYTQTFDGLANGLPTGWAVFTGASANDAGTDVSATKFTASPVKWNSVSGGFRNSASMDGITTANYTTDSAAQAAITDRALAVRQVGSTSSTFPNSDSGAAFVFKMANTTGRTNFKLNFKLQSADTSSPRTTVWAVQYGMGTLPTSFTNAPTVTGTLTSGNKLISNNTVNVDFGNTLNNMAHQMWIRIVALATSTGSGNRATTQIDDFNMTWTNAQGVNDVTAANLPLTIMGNGVDNNMNLRFTAASSEAYTVTVADLSGREVLRTEGKAAAGQTLNLPVSAASLQAGMYLVRVQQGTFAGVAKMVIR